MEFSDQLRTMRARRGLKQSELARAAHVQQATISRLEAGKQAGDSLTVGVMKRLAVALQVPFDWLCGQREELPM